MHVQCMPPIESKDTDESVDNVDNDDSIMDGVLILLRS